MGHTSFIASGADDIRAMLAASGVADFDGLFAEIPAAYQAAAFDLPAGRPELEMMRQFQELAARTGGVRLNFCGAGFYDHYIPAAVDALTSRGEFYTAYTPYQPEASQGTLQAIYEYQTAIVRLTGMDVANASLYDGGTALFEALMMALKATRRRRVLVDQGVNPGYRAMLRTYTRHLDLDFQELPLAGGRADRAAFGRLLDKNTAAVIVQNPNFFGCVDDYSDLCAQARAAGALALMSAYPVALGLLQTPGAMGADLVTGEGQSLGLPLSFGGPYLGFMAVRREHVRKMPGRIVGATQDAQGRRGFVLTLQAREQHIRREKASSNICTNEALCALRAVVYLSLLGRTGFARLAETCAARAAAARERLCRLPGVRPAFDQPFFNEFAVTLPRPAGPVVERLLAEGIVAGFPAGTQYPGMDNVLVVACTEKHTAADLDGLAQALAGALGVATPEARS